MKSNTSKPKPRILATKKVATIPEKGSGLNFVIVTKEEIEATRNPAYKYLIK